MYLLLRVLGPLEEYQTAKEEGQDEAECEKFLKRLGDGKARSTHPDNGQDI